MVLYRGEQGQNCVKGYRYSFVIICTMSPKYNTSHNAVPDPWSTLVPNSLPLAYNEVCLVSVKIYIVWKSVIFPIKTNMTESALLADVTRVCCKT